MLDECNSLGNVRIVQQIVAVRGMNACRGGGIDPYILNLGIRWGELSASCPGRRFPVSVEREMGGCRAGLRVLSPA